MRHIRPGERIRSPVADPSDDSPTRKRDEWKARTRTEGDSKAPSTSIASSTCRTAGARGKHTRNIVTTPGSVRGEKKSLEQAPVNRPEERMSPQDSASIARYRYCRGRATPKLKEEQPDGKASSSSLSTIPGVTKIPKEKGKWEASSLAAVPTSHQGKRRRGRRWIPSRENDPKVNTCSESRAEDTVYTHEAEVFEENQAGEGCDEHERQRELHAT